MQTTQPNPVGAGVNAPNISRLGPVQKWALELLHEEGGKAPLYGDGHEARGLYEEYYCRGGKEQRRKNILRVIYTLRNRGLVDVRAIPCPEHPKYNKVFIFLTPEGEAALKALEEK
ncbi:MAG: hypothetical protein QXY20_09495 [Thermofilum sp.]|uniref:hypothetical protein n=1 Tax=Thermofilum sp. TaxID=1961369 RepID=UPI003166081B